MIAHSYTIFYYIVYAYKYTCSSSDCLLGLDPHTTYPAIHLAPPFPSVEIFQQTHVEELQETKASDLDPSLTLGFYFRNKDEFDVFCNYYKSSTKSSAGKGHSVGVQLFSIGT